MIFEFLNICSCLFLFSSDLGWIGISFVFLCMCLSNSIYGPMLAFSVFSLNSPYKCMCENRFCYYGLKRSDTYIFLCFRHFSVPTLGILHFYGLSLFMPNCWLTTTQIQNIYILDYQCDRDFYTPYNRTKPVLS